MTDKKINVYIMGKQLTGMSGAGICLAEQVNKEYWKKAVE